MNPKNLAKECWQEIVLGKIKLPPEDVIEKYIYTALNDFAHEQWKRRMTSRKDTHEETDTLFSSKQ